MKENSYSKFKLLSKSESARYLGIGKEKLQSLLNAGFIRCIVLDGRIKIPLQEIQRFIDANLISLKDIKSKIDLSTGLNHNKKDQNFNSIEYFNQLREGE